jgi:AraC-like DNA-binding protein
MCGRPCALPFARDPVLADETLARSIEDAFEHQEPLAVDGIVLRLTEALLAADASCGEPAAPVRFDGRAVGRARQLLDSATTRVVASSELETVTGLTRYELARQFRAALGTSPYRYSLLRRLDRARAQLRQGQPLADTAQATGFADQAHLSRMFKAAFGVTPGRYRTLASPSMK